mmetsp:Transcript_19639/g.75403  ORF Transcript_19639/g.75403 Transcript_19639/m.75403 type:complete len:240 (-) Transcript_19639:1801-2520(-)
MRWHPCTAQPAPRQWPREPAGAAQRAAPGRRVTPPAMTCRCAGMWRCRASSSPRLPGAASCGRPWRPCPPCHQLPRRHRRHRYPRLRLHLRLRPRPRPPPPPRLRRCLPRRLHGGQRARAAPRQRRPPWLCERLRRRSPGAWLRTRRLRRRPLPGLRPRPTPPALPARLAARGRALLGPRRRARGAPPGRRAPRWPATTCSPPPSAPRATRQPRCGWPLATTRGCWPRTDRASPARTGP